MRLRRPLPSAMLPMTFVCFFAIAISGCVLPVPQTAMQPSGGAHVAVSNGGSIITVSGTLIALPGHTLKIGFFHDPQNADCSVQGDQHIVFTVLAQPQHGALDVAPDVMGFPDYPSSTLMFRCSSGKIPGTEVTYLASAGFSGMDTLSYSIYFPNGHEMIANMTIDVQ